MNIFLKYAFACVVACTYFFSMHSFKHIDRSSIEIQKQILVKTIERDAYKRIYITGGLCAATAAGIFAYCAYHACYGSSSAHTSFVPHVLSLESLQKRIVALEAFQKRIIGEPGSNHTWTWIKSMGYHLFWVIGPMLTVETIKSSLLHAEQYISSIFYTPSIEWAIHHQAHLGKLVHARDTSDLPTETLLPGQIILELTNSADTCKIHAKNSELCHLSRSRFEEAWTTVVHAIEIAIAYMHIAIDKHGPQSHGTFSLLDRADRLTKYINEISTQLEIILDKPEDYTTLPDIIRRVRSELERHVIAFKHLEANTVCHFQKT